MYRRRGDRLFSNYTGAVRLAGQFPITPHYVHYSFERSGFAIVPPAALPPVSFAGTKNCFATRLTLQDCAVTGADWHRGRELFGLDQLPGGKVQKKLPGLWRAKVEQTQQRAGALIE